MSDDLACSIYVDTSLPLITVAQTLSAQLQLDCETGPHSATIALPCGEIEVRKNEDASAELAVEFPDGFLHFRYKLEAYVDPAGDGEKLVPLIAEILRQCWSRGWAAVAASDFEEELPERGGYKSKCFPWLLGQPIAPVVSSPGYVAGEMTPEK